MDFRQKIDVQSNLSLPLNRASDIEAADDFFRLHRESPPIEDDTVYSFANHHITSSSQRYDTYNQSLESKPSRDTNNIYSASQVNQQQPQFLTISGQPEYGVAQKLIQQASPSFSNEAYKGIDVQGYSYVNMPERESVKKQIVSNSAQKHQITSPSWTSPSRKDSISSNMYSQYSYAPELNDSFTKNSDTNHPKVNTRRSTIGEEVVEIQRVNPVSTSHKNNTAPLSSESKQVSATCLVLEEATQEALRNIASKMTTSTRSKQNAKDPLNNSLLSKHLDGDKRPKTPTSVTQKKKIVAAALTSMTVRKDIAKRDTNTPNSKLNRSLDKGISRSASKNKEETVRRTPVKTGSQVKANSELNMSATFNSTTKNRSSSIGNNGMERPTLTEPCLADKADVDHQRLRTVDYATGGTQIEEEGQDIPLETIDDVIIEKYHKQLMMSIQKLTMRTFLALRSIIRPNVYILSCCQAFVKLFAGLNDAIPPSFAIMETIEWENIKILFNNPVKILKLISTLPVFIEYRKIPHRNINAAIATLSKIPYDIGDTQNEHFYHMYEFIVSAVEYYKFYKPEAAPSFPMDDTPTNRRFTVPEVSSSLETVEIKSSTRELQPPKSVRQEIGFSTPSKSKNPLGQTRQNLVSKSTCASTTHKTTRTSVSPLKENVSSRKNSQEAVKKTSNSQYNSTHRKSATSIKTNGTVSATARPTKSSLSPMRSMNSSVRNMTGHESFDSQGLELGHERSMKTEISEMAEFEDYAARKRREGLSYKARASRLVADHERYLKRIAKEKEEEKERINRELNSYDRELLADYVEAKAKAEKVYYKEMVAEEFAAKKEVKQRQEKIQKIKEKEELIESAKTAPFMAIQAERKKHEKKKELWDQYKKKMAEKLAKKQKEAEQIQIQKKEAVISKVQNLEWKRKLVGQESDKWKENYLLIEKMIGEAK